MKDIILTKLTFKFGEGSFESSEFRDELTIIVPPDRISDICRFLKEEPDLSFNYLTDLCGIDMARPEKRFGVVYNVFSFTNKFRVRLKVFVEEENPVVPTVTTVWGTANWHERETFDMFGILFEGHPDLRRVYMPDNYEYHPLRKDFPLMGVPGSIPLPKK